MARKAMKAKPARPELRTVDMDAAQRAQALVAAALLMDAFSWTTHPWGDAFWGDVHGELVRLSGFE